MRRAQSNRVYTVFQVPTDSHGMSNHDDCPFTTFSSLTGLSQASRIVSSPTCLRSKTIDANRFPRNKRKIYAFPRPIRGDFFYLATLILLQI